MCTKHDHSNRCVTGTLGRGEKLSNEDLGQKMGKQQIAARNEMKIFHKGKEGGWHGGKQELVCFFVCLCLVCVQQFKSLVKSREAITHLPVDS